MAIMLESVNIVFRVEKSKNKARMHLKQPVVNAPLSAVEVEVIELSYALLQLKRIIIR